MLGCANGLIRQDVDAPASGRAANRRRYDGGRANFSYSTAVDVRVLKGNRPNQPCMGNRDESENRIGFSFGLKLCNLCVWGGGEQKFSVFR
jgi:hypothetical protein